MLYADWDMKVPQVRLGHADYATTANMYAHLMQDSQSRDSEKLGTMMQRPEKSVVTNGRG